MGKANRAKSALKETVELVNLIQTLKDIADNKFYTLSAQKHKFRRFGESFVEFFRMISFTQATHPLIANDNPNTLLVVVTAEGSFLGKFNGAILRKAFEEKEKHDHSRYVAIGEKSVGPLRREDPNAKVFLGLEEIGLYEMAVMVKDYLVDEVVNDRVGKVIVVYSWPKTPDIQVPRVAKLLPCDELVMKQHQIVDQYANVIEESDPSDVIGYLSNLWVTTRLYEIFVDTIIASAAAQAAFLEDSVDKMKKEHTKAKINYRKAKKADIDKSLRETFSARLIAGGG